MIYVLHVVTDMNCGGLETMIMNYYRCIDRSKIQFVFLTHREYDGDYGEEIHSLGGRIYHLPILNPFSPAYRKGLSNFFDKHPEYKIIHVHQDCMSSVILKEARKHDVPVRIAHSHNSNQDKNLRYVIKLFYMRLIPKYATKLFACSEEAGRWMFQDASFEVLRNAIASDKYVYCADKRKTYREMLGVKDNEVLFGHVGRFYEQKNHRFLLDVFNCAKELVRSKIIFVGIGPLQQEIRQRALSLGIQDKVIFAGLRSDVADVMQAMDVFVFPSLYEGLGIVAIEAQAAGLPCLISDTIPSDCMITDLIEKKSLSDGAESWAKRAVELSQKPRRNTYEEIKSAGFDITENAKKLSDFYTSQWEEKCRH